MKKERWREVYKEGRKQTALSYYYTIFADMWCVSTIYYMVSVCFAWFGPGLSVPISCPECRQLV